MTTERVPTIRMLIKQWCPSGLGAESEWLIATLEARELKVLEAAISQEAELQIEHANKRVAAAKAEAAASALEQAAQLVPNCGSGYACRTLNEKFSTYCPNCKLKHTIRSLSPIPNARALWEAEARLEVLPKLGLLPELLASEVAEYQAELESAVAKLR